MNGGVRLRRWTSGVLLTTTLSMGGCVEKPDTSAEHQARLVQQAATLAERLEDTAGNEDGLVIRLAFGPEADLDLYVTDPLLESIYFANRSARSGGALTLDVRCDTTGPRMEEIRFPAPLPGRYRVGIDFPRRCDDEPDDAAFAVSVDGAGVHERARGSLSPAQFEVIVLEFEVSQ